MFGWFKKIKKNAVSEAMHETNNVIRGLGGAVTVCLQFIEFLDANPLYQSLKTVAEADSPFKRLEVTVSSLHLLHSTKESLREANDNENILKLAEVAFIASNLMLNDEELKELMLMDCEQASNYLLNKKEIARKAWENWLVADLSTIEGVVNA